MLAHISRPAASIGPIRVSASALSTASKESVSISGLSSKSGLWLVTKIWMSMLHGAQPAERPQPDEAPSRLFQADQERFLTTLPDVGLKIASSTPSAAGFHPTWMRQESAMDAAAPWTLC
ncbi:MAG: hypothetical protein R2854_08175 [Caldilineaceae bacterium]